MKLRWIGQSGYILEDETTQIIIDPYLSDVVNKVANRPRMVKAPIQPEDIIADYVVCTHDHLDHIDPESIERMNREDIHFLCPSSCKERLRTLGCNNITTIDIGESILAGNFQITAVFADHSIDTIGIIIEYGSMKLYFTSDTLYHNKLEELKDSAITIMFICINGKLGNMNVDEAVKLTKIINPQVGVPTHYGMFASNTEDPFRYTSQIKKGFIMEFNKEYFISDLLGGHGTCNII
jgi:L-ascorbate 6-phosphate lactonase